MYFIKYRTTAITSNSIIKIEAMNSMLCILYGAGSDAVLLQVPCKKNPQDVMDRLIEYMARIEAACVGNTYNIPSGGFCEIPIERVNPEALIIDIEDFLYG